MGWPIGEVARASGVSTRTLRHYDAIGLLTPAWVAHDGHRHYEEAQLLRLQQILLLRSLGVGLTTIAEILERDSREDTVAVLRRHRRALSDEQQRLGRVLETVDRTINSILEGGTMNADAMFAGFAHNPYEAEARERWGDEVVDASNERIKGWNADEADKARTGYGRVHTGLAPLLGAGVPVDDDRVQDLIALHYEVTSLFWTPDGDAYRGLGQMYVEDERFRANIGQGNDALVTYLRDAMSVYADTHLA